MCSISILYIINTIILERLTQSLQIEHISNSSKGIDNKFYAISKIPKELDKEIFNVIKDIEKNPKKYDKYNDSLAGKIIHEYGLHADDTPVLLKFIHDKFHEMENLSKYAESLFEQISSYFRHSVIGCDIDFSDNWINFQKKYEYNPPHIHSGVYSWVIWYKIPYTLEGEANTEIGKATKNHDTRTGDFVFSTPGYMYNVHQNFLLDNRLEKTFLMFPSSLEHSVLPFYSTDQYRITLAGNIHFNLQNSTFPRYPLK